VTVATQSTPQSIDPGSVISTALHIYRDQAGVLLATAFVVFTIEALLVLVLGAIVGSLLTIVVTTFYQGMVVELVRDVQDGRRDSSVGDLFRSVAPVVLPLIGVSILAGIGIVIGFILLIVPGLFLMTIWSVVSPVTVIERPGVIAAFGRSRELVRGYGMQVFGVIIVVILLVVVAGIIVGLITSGASDTVRSIVQWLINIVTAPLSALIVSVLYFGLRRARGEAPSSTPGMSDATAGWAPPSAPAYEPPSAPAYAPPAAPAAPPTATPGDPLAPSSSPPPAPGEEQPPSSPPPPPAST
jgi:hypothetical protein